MNNIYLNTKQYTYLLLPILLISICFIYKNKTTQLIETVSTKIIQFVFNTNSVKKNSVNNLLNIHYKSIDLLKQRYKELNKNLFELDKTQSRWTIAYSFKYINNLKEEKIDKNKNSGIKKYLKLQEMISKRNDEISKTMNGKIKSVDNEFNIILNMIKKRNLKNPNIKLVKIKNKLSKTVDISYKINLNNFNLQMIASPKLNPQVIINNNIYSINDYITKLIKIEKIEKDRILLKTKKDKKWLNLINY